MLSQVKILLFLICSPPIQITGCWNHHQSLTCQEVACTQGQRKDIDKNRDNEAPSHLSWCWSHPLAIVLSKAARLWFEQFYTIDLRILSVPFIKGSRKTLKMFFFSRNCQCFSLVANIPVYLDF